MCWKAGGSSRTALCPGQHSTEPHTATAGVASTATTLNNTQQHSTAASNSPTTAGATAALVLAPGLCVHPWLGRVLAIPSGAGRAGGGGSVPCAGGTTADTSGPGRHCSMQHAAWGHVGTCGDMWGHVGTCAGGGWSVVTLDTGHRSWWLESASVGGSRGRHSGQWAGGGGCSFTADRHWTLPRHTHHHIKEGNQVNVTITEFPCDHP